MSSEAARTEQIEKRNPISLFVKKYPFHVYVVLTLVLGWLPWYATGEPTAVVFVPFISALIVPAVTDGWTGVKAVLRRAIRWRAPLKIWGFLLFTPAVLGLVAIGAYVLMGGQVK